MAVDADLDATSDFTPSGTRADVVAALAEAGVDVLCEKPPGVTPERVDRTEELAAFETINGPVDADLSAYDFDPGSEIEGQVRGFMTAILEEREPMMLPAAARKALDVAFAAEESTERGE